MVNVVPFGEGRKYRLGLLFYSLCVTVVVFFGAFFAAAFASTSCSLAMKSRALPMVSRVKPVVSSIDQSESSGAKNQSTDNKTKVILSECRRGVNQIQKLKQILVNPE
jgi:hypothetical protein